MIVRAQTRESGVALLEAEMVRQHADARDLIEQNQELTKEIAASVAATGRLVLTGMGTSHYGNRVAEAALRGAGLDATAIVTSELLNSLEIPRRRTLILVSQSGESGEIAAYLGRQKEAANEYGLTLARGSPLARARRCMVAPGGAERAFASTRSFFVQVAGLSAICRALGADVGEPSIAIREPKITDHQAALEHLAGIKQFVLSGRGMLQGVAEAASLNLMELARVPVLAQEGGQLRHGPMEILGEKVGVILIRADDAFAGRVASLAAEVVAAGSPVVAIDASGGEPIPGAVTLATPRGTAFGAALGLLPTLQRLVIGLASRLVENVGEPLRSTKVTRDL
jgi:fructoselysine-6-P-deglycase FrlB-like protein